MKSIIQYIIISLLLTTVFYSCDKEEVYHYENDPRLYFYRTAGEITDLTQRDSINHTFFYLPDVDQVKDTVYVRILTMGLPVNEPRPIKLLQKNEGKSGAVVPNKHYVAFDKEEVQKLMVMPAGKVKADIPIILLRSDDLKTEKLRLEFTIDENEYFKRGVDTCLNFVVTTTDKAEIPKAWISWWKSAFGDWGSVKVWFLINYVGIKIEELDTTSSAGQRTAYQSAARITLDNYNKNNPELKEEDGTAVKF